MNIINPINHANAIDARNSRGQVWQDVKHRVPEGGFRYEPSTETVRDHRNHCLASNRTFGEGGSLDAARLKDWPAIATLWAASPDLLAACQLLAASAGPHGANYADCVKAAELARIAIAKAERVQP